MLKIKLSDKYEIMSAKELCDEHLFVFKIIERNSSMILEMTKMSKIILIILTIIYILMKVFNYTNEYFLYFVLIFFGIYLLVISIVILVLGRNSYKCMDIASKLSVIIRYRLENRIGTNNDIVYFDNYLEEYYKYIDLKLKGVKK